MNIFLLLIIFVLAQILAYSGAFLMSYFIPEIPLTPNFPINVGVLCYTMLLVDILIIYLLPKVHLVRKHDMPSIREKGTQGFGLTVVAMILVSTGVALIMEPFDLGDGGTEAVFKSMQDADFVTSALLLIFVGPLLEELIFREGLLRELLVKYKLNPILGVVITAATFGVVHGNLVQAIPSFVLGIMLGIMYVVSGDIRLSYLAHVVNNGMAFCLLCLPEWSLSGSVSSPVLVGVGALLCALGFLPIKKLIEQS